MTEKSEFDAAWVKIQNRLIAQQPLEPSDD
jgi:hypothetical protein